MTDHHEDLEDLRAQIARLTAEQDRLHGHLESMQQYLEAMVTEQATTHAQTAAAGAPAPGQRPQQKAVLRSVLIFPDATPEDRQRRTAEIAAMAPWVEKVIAGVYGREPRAAHPWCAQWWKHPEAIARLHAAWLAWQALVTDPQTGGATGPSNWERLHLDPMLAQLRSPNGPFAACMTDPDSNHHRPLPPPRITPLPTTAVDRPSR